MQLLDLLDLLDYIYKRAYVTVLINGCLLNKNYAFSWSFVETIEAHKLILET